MQGPGAGEDRGTPANLRRVNVSDPLFDLVDCVKREYYPILNPARATRWLQIPQGQNYSHKGVGRKKRVMLLIVVRGYPSPKVPGLGGVSPWPRLEV